MTYILSYMLLLCPEVKMLSEKVQGKYLWAAAEKLLSYMTSQCISQCISLEAANEFQILFISLFLYLMDPYKLQLK